jgi:hypothetical protein
VKIAIGIVVFYLSFSLNFYYCRKIASWYFAIRMNYMHPDRPRVNVAYIDAANLDRSLRDSLGWQLDYKKFRVWLSEKYHVERAYLFIGLIPKYKNLYTYLQDCGFLLAFKDVMYHSGKPKGNCDSDLLMQASSDFYEGDLNQAILVASDGDYAPLIRVLQSRDRLRAIISPAMAEKCSILLKRTHAPIAYLNDQRSILEHIEDA